jgi:ribosomal-protein-alanine N-acetyltransferase
MIRLMRFSVVVRPATLADEEALARLLLRANCLYLGSLSLTARALLDHPLQFTAWEGERLGGYLAVTILHPSTAKIEGAAIRYRRDGDHYLRELLMAVEAQLRKRRIEALIYIGQDPWLIAALKSQGFGGVNSILVLRKRGWEVPTLGNENVCVRPTVPQDIPVLVRLDEAAFAEDMWRNNAEAFQQCLNRMPYFVVAEQKGRVVGYQFSTIRGDDGYLARVAVQPQVQGQHIGARLVAEAIHFFQARRVRKIALNTQRDNYRAQRLYRWFGFQPAGQEAVVLRKRLGK